MSTPRYPPYDPNPMQNMFPPNDPLGRIPTPHFDNMPNISAPKSAPFNNNVSLVGPFRAFTNTSVVYQIDGFQDKANVDVKILRNDRDLIPFSKYNLPNGDVGVQFKPPDVGTYRVFAEINGKAVVGSPAFCNVANFGFVEHQFRPQVGFLGQEFVLHLVTDSRLLEQFSNVSHPNNANITGNRTLVTCQVMNTATRGQEPCTVHSVAPAINGTGLTNSPVPGNRRDHRNQRFGSQSGWDIIMRPQSAGKYLFYPKINDCDIPESPFVCWVVDPHQITVSGPGIQPSQELSKDTWFQVRLPPNVPERFCHITVFQPSLLNAPAIRSNINTSGLSVRSPFCQQGRDEMNPSPPPVDVHTNSGRQSPYLADYNENLRRQQQQQQQYSPTNTSKKGRPQKKPLPAYANVNAPTSGLVQQLRESELPLIRNVNETPYIPGNDTNGTTSRLSGFQDPYKPKHSGEDEDGTEIMCQYRPLRVGPHEIHVNYLDRPVPRSPFLCHIFDSNMVRIVNAPTVGHVGRYSEFEVDCVEAGRGELMCSVTHENSSLPVMVKPVEASQHILWCQFLPRAPGDHNVTLYYNKNQVHGSPFVVRVGDGESYNSVPQLNAPQQDKISYLNEALVVNQLSEIRFINRLSTGDKRDEELLQKFTRGEHPQDLVPVDRAVGLHAVVKDPHYDLVPNQIMVSPSTQAHLVEFTPRIVGEHRVEIFRQNQHVAGSPFSVNVFDPNNVRVQYNSEIEVDKDATFKIDTTRAGHVPLDVTIAPPAGYENMDTRLRPIEGGCSDQLWKFGFNPNVAGLYRAHVKYGGVPVRGSPFEMLASDQLMRDISRVNLAQRADTPTRKMNVDVYGEGLTRGVLGEKAQFYVDPHDNTGELSVEVTGPKSVTNCQIVRDVVNPSSYNVEYTPTEVGEYRIDIKLRDQVVPGSPYRSIIVAPEYIQCVSDPLVHNRQTIDIQPNKMRTLVFDCTKAGPGRLTAEITDPQGADVISEVLPPSISSSGEHRKWSVVFTPKQSGQHQANIWWEGARLKCCPILLNDKIEKQNQEELCGKPSIITVTVLEDKVILVGKGLRECVVGKKAEFSVNGQAAGPGTPRVVLTDSHGNEIPVKCLVDEDTKTYKYSYVTSKPGNHLLNIVWGDHQVRGSPFKVHSRLVELPLEYPTPPSTIATRPPQIKHRAHYTFDEGSPRTQSPVPMSMPFAGDNGGAIRIWGDGLYRAHVGQRARVFIDASQSRTPNMYVAAKCLNPRGHSLNTTVVPGDIRGFWEVDYVPAEFGAHELFLYDGNGDTVGQSPYRINVDSYSGTLNQPDASKVHVFGPGLEWGCLNSYVSRFTCDTKGAGPGQLTVKIKGPQNAFHVKLDPDFQNERRILASYDPTEPGDYFITIKWSDVHVPGSPFHVRIFRDEQEQLAYRQSAPAGGYGGGLGGRHTPVHDKTSSKLNHWQAEI